MRILKAVYIHKQHLVQWAIGVPFVVFSSVEVFETGTRSQND